MRPIQLVLAADRRMGIGRNGGLPWRLPGEMRHFRTLTTSTAEPDTINAVIMGRKTWESLPDRFRPLPGRLNVVLSRRGLAEQPPGVLVRDSLDTALQALDATTMEVEQVFVIGGGEVYQDALQRADCRHIHLTRIDADFDCDTFFELPDDRYVCVRTDAPVVENGITYHLEVLERRADD